MNTFNKRKIQASCITAGMLFLLLVAIKLQMLVTEEYEGIVLFGYQGMPLVGYILLAALICILVLWTGKIRNQALSTVLALVSLCVMPAVSFFIFEMVAGNFFTIIQNTKGIILLNLCIWYLLYALVFALSNRVKLTILLTNTVTYILAVANAFVVEFREQPIMVMDIKSFWTAASVAGEYEYVLTVNMILMGLLMLLCNLWIMKMDFKLPGWKSRMGYALITAGCVWYCLQGMLAGDFFEKAGSAGLDFFRFNLTYQTDGYMACTLKSIRYLQVEEPEGYSVERVKDIAENVKTKEQTKQHLPENMIVIMNESFADLSVLGEFETSEPVLSNFYSMQGNIKRGYVYVSAYGGGTANSEFEFLTGNSVANIPAGTVAYQMYVEKGDSSMVSLLKKNGYRTIAFHPYRKDNYNRPAVYDIYGFDEYYGRDDVEIKKVRKYASDKSDYKNLIKMCEEKKAGEKLFIFNVTMQNHSGYDYKKFKNTVSLVDCPGCYPQAEQYFSLMKKSDKALKYLLDYFSEVDEDTVILLFGDHQPNLEDGFYQQVMGPVTAENSFDYMQRRHMTPYLLWSNYELDAEEKEYISTNYLGSYLLDAVGVELPVYNQYLLELEEEIPAMNYMGYLDKENIMHWNGEEGEYKELLYGYQMFQYNNLFDGKNRVKELFE